MTQHTTMVALAREYLGFRRKMGFTLKAKGEALLRFARYADQSGHQGPITTELAVKWARPTRSENSISAQRPADSLSGQPVTIQSCSRYSACKSQQLR